MNARVSCRRPAHGRLTLAVVAAFGLVEGAAAQEASSTAGSGDERLELEEIVITATGTNIAGIKPVGSEVIALDATAIEATGLTTLGDVLRTIPQIQDVGDGFREGGTSGYTNITQGNAVNLRGMGTNATLLLVEGRRVTPTGTAISYTDSNQVPLAAIERVEVVADGASAVYGADAVAGVVNYVLRKDYEGAEVTMRYNDQGDYDEWTGSILAGTAWNLGSLGAGNVLVTYEHSDRGAMIRGVNPRLRQDLRRYGGPDWRLNGTTATPGVPGNIWVSTDTNPFDPVPGPSNPDIPSAGANTYYGLPAGTDGIGLTAADLLVNQPNLLDSSDYSDYIGKMNRDQVTVHVNQELNAWLTAVLDGTYNDRETFSRQFQSISNVSLPASSPYYISGIPNVAPFSPLNVQYNLFKDIGYTNTNNTAESYSLTAGLKAKLPATWQGELFYSYGSDDVCGVCNIGNYVNVDAFNAQVAQGNINPLSSEPLTAEQIATFTGSNLQYSYNRLHDATLKFNGPLFDLPGGKVRAAIGAEYLQNDYWLMNSSYRGADNAYTLDTDKSLSLLERQVDSAFAEVYVPIVGAGNALPLVKSLALSAAVRYDYYSDAGDTTNPKFGLTWALNDSLALRGSWGTSFRAPGLPERNPYAFSAVFTNPFTTNNSGDPDIVNTFGNFTNALVLFGANPELEPETATNWSVGFDLTPTFLEGLRFSATYYNIKYDDKITGLNSFDFLTSPENRALYDKYVTPIQNPVSCVNGDSGTYDPALLPYLDSALFGNITDYCAIRVVLDGRNTNIAASKQDGIDLQLSYFFETPVGFWNLGASVNKIFSYEEAAVEGAPTEDRLDLYTSPLSLRGRGYVSWSHDVWTANLYVNYTGSYTNDQPATIGGVQQPEAAVGSWTTADLGFGFNASESTESVWLKGVRVGVNIQNVTDKDPPIVFSSLSATSFNGSRSDPYGRTYSLSLTKAF